MKLDEFPKYDITQDGKVLSLDYNHTGKTKEVKQRLNKYGYMQLGITNKDGVRKFIQVHRLVGMAFISNPEKKEQINHKDGNKTNNHYLNLEWVTASENQKHAFRTGLSKGHKSNINGNYQGEKCTHSKLTKKDVLSIRKRYLNGEKVPTMAKEYNMSKHSIYMVVSKKAKLRTWKHIPHQSI